ncbi:MAG: PD40 domain-containing protein [Acidobacteria bacterium]|nr:PD40 domain-containing protein [Acidobacteriota bacterium]
MNEARGAAISSDGKTLVYSKGNTGDVTIWLRSMADGKEERYSLGPFRAPVWVVSQIQFAPRRSTLGVFLGASDAERPDFWLLPLDGGQPQRGLAGWNAGRGIGGAAFRWMPDGRHVLLSGSTAGVAGNHLYMAEIGTGRFWPLTAGVSDDHSPAASPDGGRIAFTSGRTDFDLVEVPLNGAPPRVLLSTSFSEENPDWSPDGAQVAYTKDSAGWGEEIWIRRVQGGWDRPLLDHRRTAIVNHRRPRFSPDGQRIAFELYGGLGHTIQISTVAGGQPVRLETESNDQHTVAWSPDGNWIAYRRQVGGKWEVAKAPSGGGGKPMTLAVEEGLGGGGGNVVWAPSGDAIAFSDNLGIHLVSPDFSRLLTKTVPTVFGFSKDSRQILGLRRTPGGGWKLVRIDVRTGEERDVGDTGLPRPSQITNFSLHPDGKRFVTAVGVAREDIWILEGFAGPRKWWQMF